jgi:hypothetical protein
MLDNANIGDSNEKDRFAEVEIDDSNKIEFLFDIP